MAFHDKTEDVAKSQGRTGAAEGPVERITQQREGDREEEGLGWMETCKGGKTLR